MAFGLGGQDQHLVELLSQPWEIRDRQLIYAQHVNILTNEMYMYLGKLKCTAAEMWSSITFISNSTAI